MSYAIDTLKNNKSPGDDCIPAEFLKCSKNYVIEPITNTLNYIIECRRFPDAWSSSIKLPIFKAGDRNIVDNYRGITILPIFEKVFENIVNRRLTFANEAFCKIDRNNGGFLAGYRTSDNLFILDGLVQRQLILNKQLYLCFVDFSKAFDLINRNVLFYKIMRCGWNGKVLDTLRSLYNKT